MMAPPPLTWERKLTPLTYMSRSATTRCMKRASVDQLRLSLVEASTLSPSAKLPVPWPLVLRVLQPEPYVMVLPG
jgi:hypothetical protein